MQKHVGVADMKNKGTRAGTKSGDRTLRRQAEQLLAVQYEVTSKLAESQTLQEALTRILETMGRALQGLRWDLGSFWMVDEKARVLRCGGVWHTASAGLDEFAAVSWAHTFAPGVGLPGRIWSSGEPAWISDVIQDPNFPRGLTARRVGLHGACAFPICREKEVVGVIEWFSREVQPPDPHLLQVLTAVGTQISQFIERQRFEEALATERNLLRTLIDTLPVYIYVKDTESRFVMNNLAHVRVLGAARLEDILGKTDLDIFPRELALQYRADEETVMRTGQPLLEREEPVVTPDGRHQWALTTKVPLKDGQGRIVGLVGVTRDITERKQAEEEVRRAYAELAKSEEALKKTLQELQASHEALKAAQTQLVRSEKLASLGMLAAGVAHEIRNPLTAIKARLFTLQKVLRSGTLEYADSETIGREISRLEKIVQDVLLFARPAEPAFVTVAAGDVMREVHALLSPQLEKNRIQLVLEDGAPAEVRLDPQQIKQVLINLVQNAAESIGQNGTVRLRTRTDRQPAGDMVILEVADTGKGISPEVQQRLFEPFVSTKHGGTGLGLSIAARITEKHGGALRYQTEVNRGTTFSLVLPCCKQEGG